MLELMVTLTVAGVVLGLAVPSFLGTLQNNRVATLTNELVTAFNLARSEAVRRSAPLTICSSTDGNTCSGGTDWSAGWVVLTDDGQLVRTWQESLATGAITADVAGIQFQARGTATAAALLTVRLPGCTGDQARIVGVNRAGRVATTRAGC